MKKILLYPHVDMLVARYKPVIVGAGNARIPGRMPGACVLHASVPVFPCQVQPLKGGHVTIQRSSPLQQNPLPGYQLIGKAT
jgi:hypothetical protein